MVELPLAMLEQYADARVVVIDDDEASVLLLARILTQAGLREVRSYTDPRLALAELEQFRPDLVLTDLRMPQVPGEEVVQAVAAHAAGTYLPVLVVTADTSVAAPRQALQAGARDFVAKPIDAAEVTLRVRNLLQTRYLYLAQHEQVTDLSRLVERYRTAQVADWKQRQAARRRIVELLTQGGMSTVFQPIFDLENRTMVAAEALARFPGDRSRGPDVWFAEAAAIGLGPVLESLAVERALVALHALPAPVFLSVNVSPAALLSAELRNVCAAVEAGRLVLELTEHVAVQDYDALARSIAAYRGAGVRVAVDDTGAGYAGLRHLLKLRPDIVKLDHSLTHTINTDPVRRSLASALVRFTRETHADLVAEGIETTAEARTLRELRVPYGQGYHLGRPAPLQTMLSAHPPATAPTNLARPQSLQEVISTHVHR